MSDIIESWQFLPASRCAIRHKEKGKRLLVFFDSADEFYEAEEIEGAESRKDEVFLIFLSTIDIANLPGSTKFARDSLFFGKNGCKGVVNGRAIEEPHEGGYAPCEAVKAAWKHGDGACFEVRLEDAHLICSVYDRIYKCKETGASSGEIRYCLISGEGGIKGSDPTPRIAGADSGNSHDPSGSAQGGNSQAITEAVPADETGLSTQGADETGNRSLSPGNRSETEDLASKNKDNHVCDAKPNGISQKDNNSPGSIGTTVDGDGLPGAAPVPGEENGLSTPPGKVETGHRSPPGYPCESGDPSAEDKVDPDRVSGPEPDGFSQANDGWADPSGADVGRNSPASTASASDEENGLPVPPAGDTGIRSSPPAPQDEMEDLAADRDPPQDGNEGWHVPSKSAITPGHADDPTVGPSFPKHGSPLRRKRRASVFGDETGDCRPGQKKPRPETPGSDGGCSLNGASMRSGAPDTRSE